MNFREKNNQSIPIPAEKVHLIFDLHGVLVSKKKMAKKYDEFMLNFLRKYFGLSKSKLLEIITQANEEWMKFWDHSEKKNQETILENYEEANIAWARICTQNKYQGNLQQLAEFLEYYVPSQFCYLYPEVKMTLRSLQKNGIKMAIASSAYTRHTFGVLVGCRLLTYFSKIIGLENTKSLKSDIRYYERAFELLKTQAENCVFIGNSFNEVYLPKKLGTKTIFVNRETSKNNLIEVQKPPNNPNMIVPDLQNLLKKMIANGIIDL
jgi:FMN phosphatase YigB (HAD superfamily)